MSNIVPNFVKFKLYRSSLYNSEFYRPSTSALLDLEIKLKVKAISRLSSNVSSLTSVLYGSLSFIDGAYVKILLGKLVSKYVSDISTVHERKLLKLGIRQPKFISPKDVIFNYSNYQRRISAFPWLGLLPSQL